MTRHLIATFAGALTMALSTNAAAQPATASEIAAAAQRLRTEALEVRQLLRASRPDLATVNQRVDALQAHAKALTESLESYETSSGTLPAAQLAALDRARVAGATLAVILSNKASMLADDDTATRQRSLLRAKADAVAKRAAVVESAMARVGG